MKVCQNLTELDSAGIKAFFDSFDTVLCDCDGVLWLTQEAIPGSPEAIQKLKTMGKRVIFVTNNSNRTRNDYAIKFKNLGYEDITKADIIQAGFLTAAYLYQQKFSQKVYVIGEDGLESELQELGIPYINQRVSTGPMVSAIKTITGKEPTVCGKPNPFVFETIQRVFPEVVRERTIMIGDRANSDILLGNRCGLKTLMVGTGCHNMEHIQQWQTSGQDDLVANFYVESLGKILDL